MKIAALILVAATLSACAGGYRPSQANCFNLVASADGGCTFTPLGGPGR